MRIVHALAALVVSFVLVACDDGINHNILDSKKSVLAIVSEKVDSVPGSENGLGTGFFIDENVIVTNNHVVAKAGNLKVASESGEEFYDAEVVDSDPLADIAVVRIKDWEKYKKENGYRPLKFAHPDDIAVTEEIYAVGHPWGLLWSVSKGVVSAYDRKPSSLPKILIQVDAHVYQGNSGGPLLNRDGEVLGINSLMLAQNGGSYGFAAPTKLIEKVLHDFEKHEGKARWALLGVKMKGTKIEEVVPGSAAEKAGIKSGDVVRRYITSTGESDPKAVPLAVAMATHDSDLPVWLTVERGDQDLTIKVDPDWKSSEELLGQSDATAGSEWVAPE